MKEKTKEFLKKNLIGFILGIISAGAVIVYAETYFPSNNVTYDNKESGLTSTNVQGAIDELYGVCIPKTGGSGILENTDIVTSGDGLYEDEYEEGKFTYKGANPNNYVTFNNEKAGWRIVSIGSDNTIKIIRAESIGNLAWDSDWSIVWDKPATLNTYLNADYYNSLNSVAKNQVVEAKYGIGKITDGNNNMLAQINAENKNVWDGKVALITISEHIRASSNTSCNTLYKYNYYFNNCKNSNWQYYSNDWWALTSTGSDIYFIFGSGQITRQAAYSTIAVRPVITLSSDVKITGGTGSQSDPYTLSL